MTDQDIISIKESLVAIENSLSNSWWQNAIMIVIGAAPTFLISYFSQRWTSQKELELFNLDQSREERKIKSELIGKIKSLENELFISGLHYVMSEILYYQIFWIKNKVPSITPAQQNRFDENVATRNTKGEWFKNCTSQFASNVAQYNYFVKDEKIDKLASEISLTDPIRYGEEFEKMSLAELNALNIKDYMAAAEQKYRSGYGIKLKELVRYIILNKL